MHLAEGGSAFFVDRLVSSGDVKGIELIAINCYVQVKHRHEQLLQSGQKNILLLAGSQKRDTKRKAKQGQALAEGL